MTLGKIWKNIAYWLKMQVSTHMFKKIHKLANKKRDNNLILSESEMFDIEKDKNFLDGIEDLFNKYDNALRNMSSNKGKGD